MFQEIKHLCSYGVQTGAQVRGSLNGAPTLTCQDGSPSPNRHGASPHVAGFSSPRGIPSGPMPPSCPNHLLLGSLPQPLMLALPQPLSTQIHPSSHQTQYLKSVWSVDLARISCLKIAEQELLTQGWLSGYRKPGWFWSGLIQHPVPSAWRKNSVPGVPWPQASLLVRGQVPSPEELMLLNCDVGEDSWESLGLQGDPTSPSWRKSTLNIQWKDWCWNWSSNTLAT